jgi:hypothetical protein
MNNGPLRRFTSVLEPPFLLGDRPLRTRIVATTLFAIGTAGAVFFAQTGSRYRLFAFLVFVATACYAATAIRPRSRARRVGRAIAISVLVLAHVLWIYLTLAFGSALAWTLPLWYRALVLLGFVLAAITSFRRFAAWPLPWSVPLGFWIAACLVGWAREEWWIRCDDALHAIAQPGVRIVVPTTREQLQCTAGASIPLGYYPRHF